MQIPTRGQAVGVPHFRKPASTARAEKHLQKARDISFVTGLTGNLLNAANQILDYQEAVELMNAETEVRKRFDDFKLQLADPNNPVPYGEYNDRWEETRRGVYEDVVSDIKLNRSRNEFERRYERMANDFGTDIQLEAWRVQIQHMKADTINNIEEAIEHNDIGKVKEYLAAARGYVFNPIEADERLENAQTRIAYNIAKKEAYGRGFEEGIRFINNPELNEILKDKGIEPRYFTDQAREELERQLRTDWNLEQARLEKEHQDRRLEQNLNVLDKYIDGSLTFEYLKDETRPGGELSDIETEYAQWINMLESKPKEIPGEEKSKWEITEPEVEAKVAKYVRRTDRTVEQKAAYIEKYYGAGLNTDDYNKYMDKIGYPAKPTEGKNPNEMTDDSLLAQLTREVGDVTKDKFEVDKKILDNVGADEQGNPRLSPQDAKNLLNWNESYKNNPAFTTALKMFETAFDDGFIDAKEMVDGMKEFEIKIASGEYTPAGLIQEAENMIALMDEEFISDKLEKFREEGKIFKQKETPGEYVERHPPEKKPLPPLEPGNITDFMEWMNVTDRKQIKTVPIEDTEAHAFNGNWYTKIRGKWYVLDLENNKWILYKRER